MDETQTALLTEQMKHAIDLLRGDLEMLQTRLFDFVGEPHRRS
jgi:hypothetical protein